MFHHIEVGAAFRFYEDARAVYVKTGRTAYRTFGAPVIERDIEDRVEELASWDDYEPDPDCTGTHDPDGDNTGDHSALCRSGIWVGRWYNKRMDAARIQRVEACTAARPVGVQLRIDGGIDEVESEHTPPSQRPRPPAHQLSLF